MLEAAAGTCTGNRKSNQDRMFYQTDGQRGVFCVADGMGGTKDGHYAAELAVGAVQAWWESGEVSAEDFELLFQAINEEILSYATTQKTTLGTTLSLVFIENETYTIAHTGDSRVYLVKKKLFGREVTMLTEDHTHAADQIRTGYSPQDVEKSPKKNMLTACLGVFPTARVFITSGTLLKGSVFVVCSDGVYRILDEKAIGKLATMNKPASEVASGLIEAVEGRRAKDNASVVVGFMR